MCLYYLCILSYILNNLSLFINIYIRYLIFYHVLLWFRKLLLPKSYFYLPFSYYRKLITQDWQKVREYVEEWMWEGSKCYWIKKQIEHFPIYHLMYFKNKVLNGYIVNNIILNNFFIYVLYRGIKLTKWLLL